jgi:hypothetical protein
MAMVGLLVALPNTQLTRRLQKEGRLLGFDGKIVGPEEKANVSAQVEGSIFEIADQTIAGLNFITTRDRIEILEELRNVIRTVYSTEAYMSRVMRQVQLYKFNLLRLPRLWELKRDLRGLIRLIRIMTKDKEMRGPFWKIFWGSIRRGPNAFDAAMRLTAMFIHFRKQRDHTLDRTQQLKQLPERSEAGREVRAPSAAI